MGSGDSDQHSPTQSPDAIGATDCITFPRYCESDAAILLFLPPDAVHHIWPRRWRVADVSGTAEWWLTTAASAARQWCSLAVTERLFSEIRQ